MCIGSHLQRVKQSKLILATDLLSCASAKAERSLSSLSCVCVYEDQNKGTLPPPMEMAYPLGIP